MTQQMSRGGRVGQPADENLEDFHERSYVRPGLTPTSKSHDDLVQDMTVKLDYAMVVRSNYEKQLHQLSGALQTERMSKGVRHPVSISPRTRATSRIWAEVLADLVCLCLLERAGENNLRVHELMQQIQHLQQSKQELHDQVEHWKYRAEAAMERKAIGALSTDQDSQGTSATEEILLDIKKLQQVVACDFVLCRVRREVNFCLTFG